MWSPIDRFRIEFGGSWFASCSQFANRLGEADYGAIVASICLPNGGSAHFECGIMEAAFRRTMWQGALSLAMAGIGPATDAGIISGLNLPTTPMSRTNRVDDFEAVIPPSSAPAEPQIVAADVGTTASSASALSAAAGEFEVSYPAAPRQPRPLGLVTGLSETGSHVVFAGGPELEALAGVDRGNGGRRANAGAGGIGTSPSAGATGGRNARAAPQPSTSQANPDESPRMSLNHVPSLLDSGSPATSLLTGEPAPPLSLPFISPPALEVPAPLPAIEPAADQIQLPDAPFVASALVASEPTGLVIMGAGLSGFIGVGLAAYGIRSQGTTRRSRRHRGDRAH